MADISNRTLVGLLVVAIVVSLAGTFVSLNKLGTLQAVSGAQTNQQGTVSLEVQEQAEVTLRIAAAGFGAGRVNGTAPGDQDCSLKSNVSASMGSNSFTPDTGARSADCVGFDLPLSFVLENTGNAVFANVTVNSSFGQLYAPILGGDLSRNGSYQYVSHEEVNSGAGACSDLTTAGSTTPFSTAHQVVCEDFQFSDAQGNAIALQVNITIPDIANATGNATDTITFVANQ